MPGASAGKCNRAELHGCDNMSNETQQSADI